MKNEPTDLDKLAWEWENAKKEEVAANEKRREIEAKIIELTGLKKEGSQTHRSSYYSVVVEGKVTRKLDQKAWERLSPEIPSELSPVVMKPDLSVSKLRALADKAPDVYNKMLLAIESKPGKPYVKVTRAEGI